MLPSGSGNAGNAANAIWANIDHSRINLLNCRTAGYVGGPDGITRYAMTEVEIVAIQRGIGSGQNPCVAAPAAAASWVRSPTHVRSRGWGVEPRAWHVVSALTISKGPVPSRPHRLCPSHPRPLVRLIVRRGRNQLNKVGAGTKAGCVAVAGLLMRMMAPFRLKPDPQDCHQDQDQCTSHAPVGGGAANVLFSGNGNRSVRPGSCASSDCRPWRRCW